MNMLQNTQKRFMPIRSLLAVTTVMLSVNMTTVAMADGTVKNTGTINQLVDPTNELFMEQAGGLNTQAANYVGAQELVDNSGTIDQRVTAPKVKLSQRILSFGSLLTINHVSAGSSHLGGFTLDDVGPGAIIGALGDAVNPFFN